MTLKLTQKHISEPLLAKEPIFISTWTARKSQRMKLSDQIIYSMYARAIV